VAATQRPSADIVPTSLRDLLGYRLAFRCSTDSSSDVILGHGWPNEGYTATDINPATRGVARDRELSPGRSHTTSPDATLWDGLRLRTPCTS
jgi:hypothetical protein